MRRIKTGPAIGLALALGLGIATGTVARAQIDDVGPAMAMGNARLVRGTVMVAAANRLTVKTEAGEVYEVMVSANTRVSKGRDSARVADIHAGDGIGAMGEVDSAKKTVHALFVAVIDAEQIKKAREAMGKTFISGTVTAIDEVKLTIKRTDDVVQVIQVDEDTSFRKGGRGLQIALGADQMGMGGGRGPRPGGAQAAVAEDAAGESLTLADVKVGSVVVGEGAVKKGVFVPTTLAIGEPGAQRQRRRPGGTGGDGGAATTHPGAGTEPKE